MSHHRGSNILGWFFFGFIAILSGGLIVASIWSERDLALKKASEYKKWYDVGYARGNSIGKIYAQYDQAIPTDQGLANMGMRQNIKVPNTDLAAYQQGFVSGFREAVEVAKSSAR